MVTAPGPSAQPSPLLFVDHRWTLATPRACWASPSWRLGPATPVQPSRQAFAHTQLVCLQWSAHVSGSALHISAASGTRGAHLCCHQPSGSCLAPPTVRCPAPIKCCRPTDKAWRCTHAQSTCCPAWRSCTPRQAFAVSTVFQTQCFKHCVCLAACTRQCLLPSLASITSRQAPWVQCAAPTRPAGIAVPSLFCTIAGLAGGPL